MMDPARIKVIIVDNSDLLRQGIKSTLANEPDIEVAGDYGTGAAALADIERTMPDVVVLSVSLPDVSGFRVCQDVLELVPNARVIMLMSGILNEEIAASMMVGAAGAVPKNVPLEDLVEVVRANGKGYMLHIPEVAARSLQFMRYNKRLIDVDRLTNRERQVLILVADGKKNAEIVTALGISPHTVRNFITRIFAKLKTSNRADLGAYATLIGVLEYDATDKQ